MNKIKVAIVPSVTTTTPLLHGLFTGLIRLGELPTHGRADEMGFGSHHSY